jgi:hypothetical protein
MVFSSWLLERVPCTQRFVHWSPAGKKGKKVQMQWRRQKEEGENISGSKFRGTNAGGKLSSHMWQSRNTAQSSSKRVGF